MVSYQIEVYWGRWQIDYRECVPIISGVSQGSALSPLLFVLHTRVMFELVVNRVYAYADDSTSLAVVCKPADRPVVAASL